jgi:hypothetical protein
MAVHPFGFHWRENLMNPMSFHFVKSTLQPDEPFSLGTRLRTNFKKKLTKESTIA